MAEKVADAGLPYEAGIELRQAKDRGDRVTIRIAVDAGLKRRRRSAFTIQ